MKQRTNPKGLSVKSTATATMLPGCAGSLFLRHEVGLVRLHPQMMGQGGFWKGKQLPGDIRLGCRLQAWH